jgi:hypothetical protein
MVKIIKKAEQEAQQKAFEQFVSENFEELQEAIELRLRDEALKGNKKLAQGLYSDVNHIEHDDHNRDFDIRYIQTEIASAEQNYIEKYLTLKSGQLVNYEYKSIGDKIVAPRNPYDDITKDLILSYKGLTESDAESTKEQQLRQFARELKKLCDGAIKDKAAQAGVVVPLIAK